jgi:general secretion pathway protein J
MLPRRGRTERGFTLVEMLVVVVIAGLLTALTAGGVRDMSRRWQKISERDAALDSTVAMRHFLLGLLESCVPILSLGEGGVKVLSFSGNKNEMTFLAPLPQSIGPGDIAQYRLRILPGGTLALDWRLDRAYPPGVSATVIGAWMEVTLVTGLNNPYFAYFGAADSQSQAGWLASWQRADAMPELIDVHLGAGEGSTERGVIVAPQVTAVFCDSTAISLCNS